MTGVKYVTSVASSNIQRLAIPALFTRWSTEKTKQIEINRRKSTEEGEDIAHSNLHRPKRVTASSMNRRQSWPRRRVPPGHQGTQGPWPSQPPLSGYALFLLLEPRRPPSSHTDKPFSAVTDKKRSPDQSPGTRDI